MTPSRRSFTTLLGLGAVTLGLTACAPTTRKHGTPGADPEPDASSEPQAWVMPDEAAPHTATWMSFAVRDDIWSPELAPAVRATLVEIANAIAEFEPVHALVPFGEPVVGAGTGVTLHEHECDDLWMRDTGPVFVHSAGENPIAAVNFNFNGWGEKQEHAADATVASGVCAFAGVEELKTELVLEGGALEVDGEGTAIITESCVLNDNRNPGWTKPDVESELAQLLGIEKVIWLPGIAGADITDGHTDFYARFTSPGVVVAARDDYRGSFDYDVTREHLTILRAATDARGRQLEVHVLPAPKKLRKEFLHDDFAAGYINFYVCNGGVIAPEFGDPKADAHAKQTLTKLFPGHTIVQLNIDPIASGGGGIHCATQQQPHFATS
ncbi:agmatine/peptidylarginine deiminase [Leucobacter luti]|uniref:agmatine deiminase family protein n=1 Tax=Leucobacter luti TaxID=340320 RepID=UPI00215D9EEF|nr:agmatine deiminase family protein [Leucobacter luti]